MELLVATRNAGKLKEIKRLFSEVGIEAVGLENFPELADVEEDGATFAVNAEKKARTIAAQTGRVTLADDSGLEVEALGGAPGVFSARFAGAGAGDADNNRKLLIELAGVPEEKRRAAFRCVMAYCTPQGACRFFEGTLPGRIIHEPRGGHGFGYDPLFLIPEYGKTLAELPLDVKNRISHRGQALRKVLAYLRKESG
ncbi:XTP/dITP diphosphatase [Geoalkalibacter halelectricus]|uniref:dITP/XTP pyrophosphatase n=1 Tax=Geoalkalibacter halelectricus TaxID=2847045 RepID=A0ABY5ZPG5_9BACT|nr:XTP/dITP diphosphatase [Geoalkalibacter halelectricus]MDO3379287.1 XTP/dITP diphosphatase [Geoalkalibacter halelectricus]UWZ81042.1 XTP/dITP diphosphatase [Geoalkalibacter halelectricus]